MRTALADVGTFEHRASFPTNQRCEATDSGYEVDILLLRWGQGVSPLPLVQRDTPAHPRSIGSRLCTYGKRELRCPLSPSTLCVAICGQSRRNARTVESRIVFNCLSTRSLDQLARGTVEPSTFCPMTYHWANSMSQISVAFCDVYDLYALACHW